ncbi:unnamed protein product, partial [marine sediment metagenome]
YPTDEEFIIALAKADQDWKMNFCAYYPGQEVPNINLTPDSKLRTGLFTLPAQLHPISRDASISDDYIVDVYMNKDRPLIYDSRHTLINELTLLQYALEHVRSKGGGVVLGIFCRSACTTQVHDFDNGRPISDYIVDEPVAISEYDITRNIKEDWFPIAKDNDEKVVYYDRNTDKIYNNLLLDISPPFLNVDYYINNRLIVRRTGNGLMFHHFDNQWVQTNPEALYESFTS